MLLGRGVERKILATTYYHKANIYRHGAVQDGWETKPGLVLLHEDVQGALSYSAKLNNQQLYPNNRVEYDAKWFCEPEYLIKAGDIIVVTFQNGAVETYKAAKPYIYHDHQEVPVFLEEDA